MATVTPKVQGQNQKDTVAGATIVTKNARLIIAQADIATIEAIPNLPEHQKAAKAQSNLWLKNIWPLIIKTTSEIIDYAVTFQQSYTQLCDLIPRLEKGDKKAKDEFVQVLEIILIPALLQKSKTAKDIASQTCKFHDDFQPLYVKFQTDFQAADKVMTKDNQEILDKKADFTEWKGKALVYESAALFMAVAVPVTATATAISLQLTGVGFLVGCIFIASEVAAVYTMLGLYSDAMHHVSELTSDIHTLEPQVAQLTLIEDQISGLQKYTQNVVTSSVNVADGWIALHQGLDNVLKNLKDISPEEAAAIINNIRLDTANTEWGIALEQAKALQPNGGQLEEKSFNTSDDLLTALDKQAKGA